MRVAKKELHFTSKLQSSHERLNLSLASVNMGSATLSQAGYNH